MNRRELLQSLIAGTGAAAVGSPQETHHGGEAAAPNTAADWKPAFFDAHQNETVIALTDLIIPATDTPGAKQAQVNRWIDLMLHESPADIQSKFLRGLAWLDGYAIRRHGAPFVSCTFAQQTALLESLDPQDNVSPELQPGAAFFRDIKQRTVSGYYKSRIGIEELNKGGRVPATFGCQHGGHPS
jgi:gluconate 2-dehydrogenase gamma chain